MSEFKFVQWGKGIPVDYQRLNAMMLNEQYLKDKADPAPRGILLRKRAAAITYDPSGGWQDMTGLTGLTLTVPENNRLISFEFQSGRCLADAPCEVRFKLNIDGTPMITSGVDSSSATSITANSTINWGPPVVFTTFPASVLTAGTYTITAQFIANSGISVLILGESGCSSLIIRDEGSYISETA